MCLIILFYCAKASIAHICTTVNDLGSVLAVVTRNIESTIILVFSIRQDASLKILTHENFTFNTCILEFQFTLEFDPASSFVSEVNAKLNVL